MEGGEEIEHERSVAMHSDCVYDFYCEYCKDEGLNTEAEGYCVDCNDYLCQGCINAHKRSRPTRHHELLDQNEMPKETALSQERVNREVFTKCKVHSNKVVEYYCASHRELVCSACFVKVHRYCNEIQSIHEESENIIGSREYNEFSDGLKVAEKLSRDMISTAHDNKAASGRLIAKATERVKRFRAEVNAIFDEMENTLLIKFGTILSEDNDAMDKMIEQLTEICNTAKSLTEETEKLASSKLVCQLVVQIKEKQNDLVNLKEKLRQAEERNKVRMIEFEPNNEVKNAFRVTGIGKIKVQTRRAGSEEKARATVATAGDPTATLSTDVATGRTTHDGPVVNNEPRKGKAANQTDVRTAQDVSTIKNKAQAPTSGVPKTPIARATQATTDSVSQATTTRVSQATTTRVSQATTTSVPQATTASVSQATTTRVSEASLSGAVGVFRDSHVDFSSSSKIKSGNLNIVELSSDRIQYEREFLLQLQFTSASMVTPPGLPDIPDIMHIQPSTDQELVLQLEEIIERDKQPFVLQSRVGPNNRKGQKPRPNTRTKREDIAFDPIHVTNETKSERQIKVGAAKTESKASLWTGDSARSATDGIVQPPPPLSTAPSTHTQFAQQLQQPQPYGAATTLHSYGQFGQTRQAQQQQPMYQQAQQQQQTYPQASQIYQHQPYPQQFYQADMLGNSSQFNPQFGPSKMTPLEQQLTSNVQDLQERARMNKQQQHQRQQQWGPQPP